MRSNRLWMVLGLAAVPLAMASCGSSPAAPSLPAPSGLVATAGVHRISLSWTAVAGATSYRVFRGGGQIADVAATTYTDSAPPASVQSCYTVRAVEGAGLGADSSQACATPLPDYAGSWSGTTSQGNPVSFFSPGDSVQNFRITARVSGGGCTVTSTSTFGGSYSIVNGSFSMSSTNWQIQGTFASETTVSGTATYTSTGTCGGLQATFTWTATK